MNMSLHRRRGFTLIELLVVIGIMAALLVAAGPMWNGLTRSSGVKGATMQLRTVLSLARQWAITHRQKTYVIFPTTDSNMQYRAYTVYAITDPTTGAGEYVREWEMLPQGVRFSPDGVDNVLAASSAILLTNVTGVAGPVKGFVFRSDGSSTGISDIMKKPNIGITEGIRNDSTGVFTAKPNAYTNFLEISSMAGQLKVIEK